MESSPLRVAVVGAGISGLTAIKCCLDEGITPVCFERTDHMGGLWHYTDQPVDGQTCVMKSTVINSCKELMSFSDFPPPAHFPNYMHNSQVLEYLHQYAAHFDLERHIHYQTEVTSIKKAQDFATTGQWEITRRHRDKGQAQTELFDGVFVCSGPQAEKRVPVFPGLENFQGKVIHTHDYRVPAGFEDKRILIVGIGNSAGDCAVELSRVAKQVFLSTRRGTWVFHRLRDNGLPYDLLYTKRLNKWIQKWFSGVFEQQERRRLNNRFDHKLYRLRPAHSPWSYQPLVNDDIPNRIVSGSVKVKDDVKQFTQHGVEFMDGTREAIDVVIFATGYKSGFPFIDKEVLEVKDNAIKLYKLMYPPDHVKHTMAVIGCMQPLGSLAPMCEMQCRLATRVLKGLITLPGHDGILKDMQERDAMIAKTFLPSKRYCALVEYVSYMDELSKVVGCYPDYVALLLKEPVFAVRMLLGPVYPYVYRLCGPGQWRGAREAILTAWDRVEAPFGTRPLPKSLAANDGHATGQLLGQRHLVPVYALVAFLALLTFVYC